MSLDGNLHRTARMAGEQMDADEEELKQARKRIAALEAGLQHKDTAIAELEALLLSHETHIKKLHTALEDICEDTDTNYADCAGKIAAKALGKEE